MEYASGTVKELLSGYEAFVNQRDESFSIDDVAFRCSRGIFWSIVLHDLADQTDYILVCQWDSPLDLFAAVVARNIAYLKVADFKLANKDGKFGQAGHSLVISPTTADRIGFEGLRNWALSQKGDAPDYVDLVTVCRVLRGRHDIAADFEELFRDPWPPGRWEAFVSYFGEVAPSKPMGFDHNDCWFRCLYLLTAELEEIDRAYAVAEGSTYR